MVLLKNFKDILTSHKLVREGDRIIVAYSGGVDSTVLLDLLNSVKGELNLTLIMAHVNHGIRKNASRDAEFAKKTAAKFDLNLYITKLKPPTSNIEEALRERRYELLDALAVQHKADVIATAHHRDDNIETALMNLMRGASFKGLSGMKLKSGNLIRPLLPFTKLELISYAKGRKIKWVEDETNTDEKYFRNRVRHKVIPYLVREAGPEFKDNFVRFMMSAREAEDFLNLQARSALSNIQLSGGALDLKGLRSQPALIQKQIIKLKAEEVMGDLRGIGAVHLEAAVRTLAGEHSNKVIEFPRGLKIRKKSARVTFER